MVILPGLWKLHTLTLATRSYALLLGQTVHLGPGTDDAERPCQGQPWMFKVVLGQMEHLGPGVDDANRP